jgi:hypothetical protein
VGFLDEFENFGQTFGDINVSIDSFTFKSFGDRSPNQNLWLKFAN